MHLSPSQISVLATNKVFHYNCFKGIQMFMSAVEKTVHQNAEQHHLRNSDNICPHLPSCSCGTAVR